VSKRTSDVYYDPYDYDIDADPHPIWKRMRDELPLYRNDRYDFWALSRFADVESCSIDWRTFSSARGSVLEAILSGLPMPPGFILFEDPPIHDAHRGVLSRVFTPRRVAALEPQIREICAQALDPFVGSSGFDFVRDLGAKLPMRVIGKLLGIPSERQEEVRDRFDRSMHIEDGDVSARAGMAAQQLSSGMDEFVSWRRQHPADDVITELINATFVDDKDVERQLSEEELVNYVTLLAAAGNETVTRLIGWTGYVLAKQPEQRAELVGDPLLVPGAIEEILRYEAPSPVQARLVTRDVDLYGSVVREGEIVLLLTGSANRDDRKFDDPDRFDIHRRIERHLSFGHGIHFCLGAALARMEGRVALEEVLKRFPTWQIDEPGAEMVHTSTVRGWERLPVVL